RYTLDGAALLVDVAVRNTGAEALPFGIGLHPWMPDPPGAQLEAVAKGVWLSGADKLPVSRGEIPGHWRFDP
ncbi:hypothetical protein, partial [Stenotrophomonas maltophilia]|uniref:hypothetical protein n=1 Tax=Stenotrophomonas maltophilia TaxID=40324 RepID=UPI001953E3A6